MKMITKKSKKCVNLKGKGNVDMEKGVDLDTIIRKKMKMIEEGKGEM